MRIWVVSLLFACGPKPAPSPGDVTAHITTTQGFVETSGFASSVVLGAPIALAMVRDGASEGTAATDMTLQVSGGAYRLVELAPGQVIVWFDEEADYALTALRFGGVVGVEPYVRARPVRRIRPAVTATRITEGCEGVEDVPIENIGLAQNQEVHLTFVGVDEASGAMVGTLRLATASPPSQVSIDTPFFGAVGLANTLVVRPAAALGETLSLTVVEQETQTSVTITLPTSAEPALCMEVL